MNKTTLCAICDNQIPNGKIICDKCKKEILNCPWLLTCDCEEDNCMSLCRDCILNGKKKPNRKLVLNTLAQEIGSEN